MWKLSFVFIVAILTNAQPSIPPKPSVHISGNIFPCLLRSNRLYKLDGDSEVEDSEDDEHDDAPLCNNCRPIHITCRDHPGTNCSEPEIVDDPQAKLITKKNVTLAEGAGLERMINCIDGRWTSKKWKSSDVTEFLSARCII